jgi:hypothetical protein
VPLARIFRIARCARRAALRHRQLAGGAEPALTDGRGGDERRRVRRRVVRRPADAGDLPQHRAGVERPKPARDRRTRQLRSRLRAHSRLDRVAGAADELPSVPARALALDAQRPDSRLRDGQARPRAGDRPGALPGDRRHDRLRAAVPSGAHLRPRGRSADGGTPRDRLRRIRRAGARRRAPLPGHDRNERRGASLGVPILERGSVTDAVLQHRRADAPRRLPRQGDSLGGERRGEARRLRTARRRASRCVERGAGVVLRRHSARPGRAAPVHAHRRDQARAG